MMEDELEDDFDEEFFANIDKVVEQYKAQKATVWLKTGWVMLLLLV